MQLTNSQASELECGTVQVCELGDEVLSQPGATGTITVQYSLYEWSPITALNLPADFKLSLGCYTAANGERWFFPSPDAGAFLRKAALAGYAIGEYRGEPSPGYRFSTAIMLQLFQQSVGLREHLMRKFKQLSDLLVSTALQSQFKDLNILPDDLGILPDDLGPIPTQDQKPWTVEELLKRGREEAIHRGVPEKMETRIRLGLLEAARLNPIRVQDITEQESLSVVRRALFGLGLVAKSTISQDDAERTMQRMLAALEKHVGQPAAAFKKWLDNPDNLVHAVSKQKKGDGPIPREHVHQILLEAVFSAHVFVADNMDVAMRDFSRALPGPLSKEESARFSAVFFRQPALGGLSLLLLNDRIEFLKEIGGEVLRDPTNPQLVGVLLRMLEFYGDMCEKRRKADAAVKKMALAKNIDGMPALHIDIVGEIPATVDLPRIYREIADDLRERKQLVCKCNSPSNWECVPEDCASQNGIVWQYRCETCGHCQRTWTSYAELSDLSEVWREDDEPS